MKKGTTSKGKVNNSIQTTLRSIKQEAQRKSGATKKIMSKSDWMRKLAAENRTATQIKETLEKKGYGVWPSEIYRVMKNNSVKVHAHS